MLNELVFDQTCAYVSPAVGDDDVTDIGAYNVSHIPLFTILLTVIDVDVGNVDVGK